jgi:hypothetical protein
VRLRNGVAHGKHQPESGSVKDYEWTRYSVEQWTRYSADQF